MGEAAAIQTAPAAAPTEHEFMTVDELAELLRVSRYTVYRALEAGKVPGALRLGATWRIRRSIVLDPSRANVSLTRRPRRAR